LLKIAAMWSATVLGAIDIRRAAAPRYVYGDDVEDGYWLDVLSGP
jgi:hypothetical protein